MKRWTAERAFETIHRLSVRKVKNASAEQLDLMRKVFVYITGLGELRYASANFQVWEDENGDLAIIDRILGEASVLYSGLRYVIEPVDEG